MSVILLCYFISYILPWGCAPSRYFPTWEEAGMGHVPEGLLLYYVVSTWGLPLSFSLAMIKSIYLPQRILIRRQPYTGCTCLSPPEHSFYCERHWFVGLKTEMLKDRDVMSRDRDLMLRDVMSGEGDLLSIQRGSTHSRVAVQFFLDILFIVL